MLRRSDRNKNNNTRGSFNDPKIKLPRLKPASALEMYDESVQHLAAIRNQGPPTPEVSVGEFMAAMWLQMANQIKARHSDWGIKKQKTLGGMWLFTGTNKGRPALLFTKNGQVYRGTFAHFRNGKWELNQKQFWLNNDKKYVPRISKLRTIIL